MRRDHAAARCAVHPFPALRPMPWPVGRRRRGARTDRRRRTGRHRRCRHRQVPQRLRPHHLPQLHRRHPADPHGRHRAAAHLVRKLRRLLRPLLRRPASCATPPNTRWPSSFATSTRPSASDVRAAAQPFTGSPPRPTQPQLRIGVPGGNTRRNIATRRRFGLTTTGLRAAFSSGRSALLSEYATAIWS